MKSYAVLKELGWKKPNAQSRVIPFIPPQLHKSGILLTQ